MSLKIDEMTRKTKRTREPEPASRSVDLGFDKPAAECRIVVAMSGGVDSSCVAALLAEAGCEVIGVTLQLYDHGQAVGKKGACCAGQDIQDAKNVAEQLGIPHYVLDFEQRFKDAVIEDFAQSYADGITPVPCIRCNQRVKFRDLLDIAKDLGADALATGHYVRRVVRDGIPELRVAVDAHRDQSYFLFATTQDQLDFLRFPLGDLEKTDVRKIAERFGLVVADKPDSQDICFVPNGSYADIVQKLRPGAAEPGDIVHVDGRILGRHEGLIHYTVGQRRGLAVAVGEPLYVVRLEPDHHRLIVGPRIASLCAKIELKDPNWLGLPGPGGLACAGDEGLRVQVKHRAREPAVGARVYAIGGANPSGSQVTPLGGAEVEVIFDEPQTGVAPGQACVIYQGPRVLGGGWIKRAPLIADQAPMIAENEPVAADDLDDFVPRRYMALGDVAE